MSLARSDYELTQLPEWVGLANFQRLQTDRIFWQCLKNTFIYIIGVVPGWGFAPLGLAILVERKLRGISWFPLLYYSPVLVSMVVAGIACKALLASNGLINQWLKQLGFDLVIPWLTSPELAI